ncbi:MAG TPA: hypothetical protein DCQ64_01660 [Candidatus Rokubacteria bacterium]|nr:hypothetical protein [Candidatus Rokubacteria bacterium]
MTEKTPVVSPVIAMLIGQAINIAARAVSGGLLSIPDAVPLLKTLNDALGHATAETDEDRTARRAAAEEIFARHTESLLPVVTP